MRSWRLALRIARREVWRARGRSLLALVMITLPVLGVVTADVLYRTQSVSAVEGLDRQLGTHATALVTAVDPPVRITAQEPVLDRFGGGYTTADKGAPTHPATRADIASVIGSRPAIDILSGDAYVDTEHGKTSAIATEVDLRSPLAAGLFRLDSGRWPTGPDEVVVNADLARRGPGLGRRATITRSDGTATTLRVVGIAESATYRSAPVIAGSIGAFGLTPGQGRQWLLGGAPVTWHDVERLNRIGVVALSRQVVEHPPAHPPMVASSDRTTEITVLALVVAMVLIEVVLLAGPAFAVGARRQQRDLALLAAAGGTPQQARRVVLASAVVLGAAAAALGVGAGIGLARLLQPSVQRMSDTWFGPFQVAPLDLLGVAVFGLVSALLAAVVPAWVASRQDVVAVLAGRRGDARPSRRSPVVGVVLLGVGVALAVAGAHGHGTESIAFAAVVCVLGMLLLVPMVVAGVARLGRYLPLPLRFAVRDAARHRTRTTPAVAAVAATVAGVVALGISTSSDSRENRETYLPMLAMGDAVITPSYDSRPYDSATDWDDLARRVRRIVPAASLEPVVGVDQGTEPSTQVSFRAAGANGASGDDELWPYASTGAVAANELVSDGRLPTFVAMVPGLDAASAERVLAAGGVVVFNSSRTAADRVEVTAETDDNQGNAVRRVRRTVPALVVDVGTREVPVAAILSTPLATALGLTTDTAGLYLHRPHLSDAQQQDIGEALAAAPTAGDLYVERGYQEPSYDRIVKLVLAALGAILMLGGTLTATFLALADARPDLATLSAIGAAPRTRRGIAAAYALAIGLVGAVLGAAVGLVPGIAVSYPLTRTGSAPGGQSGPFIDIPWLMILGLVIGLPLLVSAVVALVARSRLPLTARLE